MKSFISALALVATMGSASAQEPAKTPTPAKPTCGATVEACQAVVDGANQRLAQAVKAQNFYKQLLVEANDRLVQEAASH